MSQSCGKNSVQPGAEKDSASGTQEVLSKMDFYAQWPFPWPSELFGLCAVTKHNHGPPGHSSQRPSDHEGW